MTDENDIDFELTPNTAAALVTRIDTMLPGILASDERDARRAAEAQRRRLGLEITPDDTAAYMLGGIDTLLAHIRAYHEGKRDMLVSEAALLAYAERAAMYAMRDYARETSEKVMRLWDAWNAIHTAAQDAQGKPAAVLLSIERIAQDAQQIRREG